MAHLARRGRDVVEQCRPAEEHGAADDQPARSLGRDVEQHQEEAEEQQAGAEVLLEDQDAEADQPHREDRPEVAPPRQVDEQDAPAGEGEGVAVQDEVAGEGDHQQHLGDLAGLEAEGAEPDPDPGAVDGRAQARDEGEQQQPDRGEAQGVGDPLQHPVVAQEDQGEHEQDDAEGHPDQLALGEAGLVAGRLVGQVEPVDHRQPESVEGGHDRQQHRVGVRRRHPDHDVRGDHQGGQPAAVPEEVGGNDALDAQPHRGVGADADRQREDEQEQLRAAAPPVHESHDARGLRHLSRRRSR